MKRTYTQDYAGSEYYVQKPTYNERQNYLPYHSPSKFTMNVEGRLYIHTDVYYRTARIYE